MAKNQNNGLRGFTLPQDFFTAATFGTCSGCAMITWIVTGVLSGLFHANAGIVGLIVAMIVAYAGLLLSSPRQKTQYIITFFNGFLIYATVVGATSFLPYVNQQTANVVEPTKPGVKASLARPWIYDRNLVSTARNLNNIQKEQSSTLEKLDKTITSIEGSLKQEESLSAQDRTRILNQLSRGKEDIRSARLRIRRE